MVEYTIGVMRDRGRARRYLRIKSDEAVQVLDSVVSFTKEQEDKRSVYECILGDLLRRAQEGGFFYEWYELESVLVETDHSLPVAAEVRRMNPEATIAAVQVARMTLPGLGLNDGQKLAVSALYEDWAPGVHKSGEICNADGQTWECIQNYDNGVYPDIAPGKAAWGTFHRPLHGTSPETARGFVVVTGAHDTYKPGEYAWFGGTLYLCSRETSYSPADYPQDWEEVTEQ